MNMRRTVLGILAAAAVVGTASVESATAASRVQAGSPIVTYGDDAARSETVERAGGVEIVTGRPARPSVRSSTAAAAMRRADESHGDEGRDDLPPYASVPNPAPVDGYDYVPIGYGGFGAYGVAPYPAVYGYPSADVRAGTTAGIAGESPSINLSGSPLINPGAASPAYAGGIPLAAPGSGYHNVR